MAYEDYEIWVSENIDLLPGKPELVARQFHTQGGIIDILAKDKGGNLLVIEVKQGIITPWACIQVLRYCGAVLEHLRALDDLRKVKGILIGAGVDKHAKLILQALPTEIIRFIPIESLLVEGGENAAP